MHSLSEPENECSDCSSYEEIYSVSDEEEVEVEAEGEEFVLNEVKDGNRRGSSASNYRSWYVKRRRGSKTSSETSASEITSITSKSSLTVINEARKNWWYWTKFAVFVASPFIARQLGIIVGKRILGRIFKSTTTSVS